MNKTLVYIFFLCMLSCSPYKKVVVSGSEQLTNRWKGQTEQAVHNSLGSYKFRSDLSDGFLVRYDYSFVLPEQLKKAGNFQIRASDQGSNVMTPPSGQPEHRSPDDSVIRRMDFYFDKARRVQYVEATGFPDSVYIVKRK